MSDRTAYRKAYYAANKEKIQAQLSEWRAHNKQRVADYKKSYASKHKASIAEKRKERDLKNKAYIKAYMADWRKKNRARLSEYQKNYVETNKPYLVEQQRQHRMKNRARDAASLKAYRQTHAGKMVVKAFNSNRRARTKDLSKAIVQLAYESNIKRFGRLTCYLCEIPIEVGKSHLEHKLPLSRGGGNCLENLDIACRSCNLRKNAKTVEEFKAVLIGQNQ